MRKRFDVVVIGGGQAGLAMGRELAERGLDFMILEGYRDIGHTWRNRWDSLTLFTPARYCGLPGLPFPGEPDDHPTKGEVVGYLEAYARAFRLPLALDEPVRDVRRADRAGFAVTTDHARYLARNVVVATGPFQTPTLPPFAGLLPAAVVQLHSAAYRKPAELPDGPALVVGGGNSGVQIAAELARTRPTTLAVGSRLRRLPATLFGHSIFYWLDRSGAMSVSVDSPLGRRASRKELLIGVGPQTIGRDLGVRVVGRAVGVTGSGIRTSDDHVIGARTVIWATGYRSDYTWLRVPGWQVPDRPQIPRHHRGVTPIPGLYFLGLSWQHTRGSALLGWVGRDAAHLAESLMFRHTRGVTGGG